jgi:hypothetical protein
VTGIALRIDRQRDGLLLMPIPHGARGSVLLRLDRLAPKHAGREGTVMALDAKRRPLGAAVFSRSGSELTLTLDRPEAWFYKITLK